MHHDTPELFSLPALHLPVIRGVIDQLGIREVIDHHLPKHSLAKVSDADCIKAMLLPILSGRQALWRMDHPSSAAQGTRKGPNRPQRLRRATFSAQIANLIGTHFMSCKCQ